MESWSVYIVRCVDGSLYTGIAKDVARRVEEHNANDLLAANTKNALFLAASRWTRIYFGWPPNSPDEGDNHLME